jgi:hypothetical protein
MQTGRYAFVLAAALTGFSFPGHAQSFESGSDGSDGALNLTSPAVVIFGTQGSATPVGRRTNSIYHFTSIFIGPGVTVKFPNSFGPVFWLAKGDVRVDGIIDMNGEDGSAYSSGAARVPTLGGAGGYGGGVGALGGNPAQAGEGPGGGGPGQGARFSANKLLVPLVGGSGGGGSEYASGGGGGGALLIASSTSIIINGTISANGGNQSDAGFAVAGGGGGSIRLVAPVISGSKALLTARGGGGSGEEFAGKDGEIRLEAFQNDLRGDVNGTPLSAGRPLKLFLPQDPRPSVRITGVSGTAAQLVSANSLEVPKATIEQATPVTITLEAHFIKPGTVIDLQLFSANGRDQTLSSSPIAGTFEHSSATVSVSVPGGLTRLSIKPNLDSMPNEPKPGAVRPR